MAPRSIPYPVKVHLIQPRDLFGPPERQDELRRCWHLNTGLFDHYTHPAGQPTFAELFATCLPGMVNVIANADIYFSAASVQQIATLDAAHTCWALSRYDVREDGSSALWDHADSQDVWIFIGKPSRIYTWYVDQRGKAKEIALGVAGCDNAIAHRIKQAGYNVLNPSKTIAAYHLHLTPYRSYLVDPKGRARGGAKTERIPPPYHLIHPTAL